MVSSEVKLNCSWESFFDFIFLNVDARYFLPEVFLTSWVSAADGRRSTDSLSLGAALSGKPIVFVRPKVSFGPSGEAE